MKRTVLCMAVAVALLFRCSAYAEKARDITTAEESSYHYAHLQRHLNDNACRGTGNYLKVRKQPKASQVLGHLEQADRFELLEFNNGYARVRIIYADKTSPDSFEGLEGWVDADYIDCTCSEAQYSSWYVVAGSMSANAVFPEGMPRRFSFMSGAGAWSTDIVLNEDGTFAGHYHDTDMGDSDDRLFPEGTQYFCYFTGRFTDIRQVTDYAYSMRLVDLRVADVGDHIADGVRYIAGEPYGFERGDAFCLYMPNTPLDALSEGFLSWRHGRQEDGLPGTLGSYAILNCTTQQGFF